MDSRPNPTPAAESNNEDLSRIRCSHQSTRLLLVLLILVTLNVVAAYDCIIAGLLKLFPRRRQQPLAPPIAIDFRNPPDPNSASRREAS